MENKPTELEQLKRIWYSRNPVHERNADSDEDMFWETVLMVIKDFNAQQFQTASHLPEGGEREVKRTPIQDALYATRRYLTTEATELADNILDYLEEHGYTVLPTSTQLANKEGLSKIRNYFGEHDKTSFEHWAYNFIDKLLFNHSMREILTPTPQPSPASKGMDDDKLLKVLKCVEYIKRNVVKINQHTWQVYKDQILGHIEDAEYLATQATPVNDAVEASKHNEDANVYIDRAIAMLKEEYKDEWLIAGYNGIVSLLGYAKESHAASKHQPREESDAVEFAEWCFRFGYRPCMQTSGISWIDEENGKKPFIDAIFLTTKELYSIFKQHKQ